MIAILILAHKNEHQVKRLISSLKHPEIDIYIHADLKFSISDFKNAKMIKQRYDIKWGDINLVNAEISALKEIKNKKYSHYFIISGQDYPIVSPCEIIKYTKSLANKSVLSYIEVGEKDGCWDVSKRYKCFHFQNEFLNKISHHLYHHRKFIKNYIPYGGSVWCILSHESVEYLIKKYDELNIAKRFRMTSCMDEIIIQSILCNSSYKDTIINECPHYIDWSDHQKGKNKGNPNILTINDYDKIIASGKLFARKFDEQIDSQILDMLDKNFHNKVISKMEDK